MNPTKATIPILREALSSGTLTPLDLVEAHLDRIRAADTDVQAFVHVDAQGAREAARANIVGPLRGLPFGIKDVLDTCDMPTEHGSALYAGARPRYDAGCVALLRGAGAIALGKTATAEMAGTAPPATTHPAYRTHTPGGSSSGSAAAVAAGMVVFALGTQTGGSVLRPAAFCGVAGFKPSYGLWPIFGMLPAAHSFDSVGVIARCAGDLAIIHAAIMRMPEVRPHRAPARVSLCRTHLWETVSTDAAAQIEAAYRAFEQAGAAAGQASLPEDFARLTDHRAIINAFERTSNTMGFAARKDGLRAQTRTVFERGLAISGGDYIEARRALEAARANLDAVFGSADVLLAPVTPDVAPEGLEHTGDPRLQEIWSMLHCPSVTIPFGKGHGGLPLGVQLVARPFDDDLLLAAAQQLERLRLGQAI